VRIGNIDGTPEEIRDLCELHNLSVANFIDAPPRRSHWGWVILPAAGIVLVLVIILFAPVLKPRTILICLTLGAGFDIWLASTVHLSFRNTFVTWLVLIGGFVLLLMACGVMLPEDVLDLLKKQKPG